MKKETQQLERRGLPGGPNEMFTYTTGIFSTEGFRMDSPDVNNYQNIIPSGSISMKERDGSPLRKGLIHGVDNLGYEQIMYPGFDYEYPGDVVTETLMAKMGGALLDKTIKCGNCGWEWKAADGGSDLYDCHKCKGGKGLIKAQRGLETSNIKSWFAEQMQSPVYKRNLENSGYKDVDAEIAKRLSNIDKTKYIADENRLGTYYNPGSKYIHHSPMKDIQNWEGNAPESEYILAHEFGHSGVAKGPGTRLNKYDIEQLGSRNKNKKSYPWENYADQKALQYEAAKLGIYNPGTEEFTQEHLNKLKNAGHKSRALENYSDQDLIWLMNNIAQVDNQSQLPVAQMGGAGMMYADKNYQVGELTEYQKKGEVKIDLKHSQDIYDQIRPSDYTSLGNYGRYLFGMSRGEDEYDDARSEEAFKQYLGLNSKPKYLSVSKYTPSIKGEGKKGSYYKVDPQLEQDIFYSYKDKLKLNQVLPTGENDVKSDFPEGTPMTSDGYVKLDPYDDNLLVGRPMVSRARMLGNFNVSRGKDEKGEYISYSDQYDFPGVMQSRMKGKPYKIYNRIYYNDMKEEGGETITPADTTAPSPLIEYVVKKGDTLSKIAAANNTSVRSIMKNNESIADPNVISINQKINLATQTPNAPVEEVYKDWNTIRDKKDKINKLSDEQKIVSFHNNKPEESYLIVDKKNAVMKLYTGGNLTKSFEVGVGQNSGDAQTVTKVKDGKTDWSAGNKSTGAGIYTISNINPASTEYYNEPAFNLKNENGIEVATTIHGTPKSRRIKFNNGTVVDNRMSNGCINGKCEDLKELYGQLDVNTKVYILPEDKGNNFQIIDGKPALKVSSQNRQKYNSYVDQKGAKQKGQGANQTTNTLVYKPIKATLDEERFKDNVFQWNDFNDEKEYASTTKPFIAALTTGKKDVMKAAKISSDVYNELAKMSFGIYGTESNFGDTHSAVGNLARATNKVLDSKSSSSPDYKSKASTYGADEDYRSVGLTQLRWNYLNKDEKAALKQVGITSNKDFLDPKKAAIGTVTVLGVRYNQQLNDKQKQDVFKYLPAKWNNRANYSDRVKSNSSYLSFKQLDKKQEGGESKLGPLMKAYSKLSIQKKMGGVITNKKQFGGQLNSGNITMYRDYIKGTIGNEIEAIKNYDKLNRVYHTKAKELGMTSANYIMTYIANNS